LEFDKTGGKMLDECHKAIKNSSTNPFKTKEEIKERVLK
jgi:hypothetical protein